jgi:clusterin-associated protein 1
VTSCRYDPDTGILDDIDTPSERVQFLQDIAQTMYIKARLKLNIKRLYAADGKAVRELLKLADLLYKASLHAKADPEVQYPSSALMSRCAV